MAGLLLLWRAAKRGQVPWSTRIFGGALALGWGVFNLVEGVISFWGSTTFTPAPASSGGTSGFWCSERR